MKLDEGARSWGWEEDGGGVVARGYRRLST